jgi:hypothetical protein
VPGGAILGAFIPENRVRIDSAVEQSGFEPAVLSRDRLGFSDGLGEKGGLGDLSARSLLRT